MNIRPLVGKRLILPALLLIAHSIFYYFALGRDAVDDAFISFRYAQNAILGHGLVFNPGERVEGFTNFLWTAGMIPLEGAGIDVGRASMLLGALCALGTMALVLRFAQSVNAPSGAGRLAVLLLAVDGTFALWAISGLETALFAFLIFAGALLYVREQSGPGWAFSGVFFALAAMTRPEGLMVFAITVAHQALWRLVAERRLLTRRDWERVFAFGIIFVPYWVGRWQYYHSFLPNSFHAKVSTAGPSAQWLRGWNHLSQFVSVHLGWVIVLPPAATMLSAMRHRPGFPVHQGPKLPSIRLFWTSYLTSIVVPYVVYIVYVGGDWSVGRFFVPLLAPFYLLFSTGAVEMWNWVVDKWTKRTQSAGTPLWITVVFLSATVVFWASSWNGEYGIFIKGFDAGTATAAREAMGKWLRGNTPPGTLIAVDAAGQVPYFSGLPAVDMFGINDLHIGRLPVATLGQGTPGHEKFDLAYVVGRAPQYVIIYGALMDGVKEYERAPATWTDNPEYLKFLTLYRRRP